MPVYAGNISFKELREESTRHQDKIRKIKNSWCKDLARTKEFIMPNDLLTLLTASKYDETYGELSEMVDGWPDSHGDQYIATREHHPYTDHRKIVGIGRTGLRIGSSGVEISRNIVGRIKLSDDQTKYVGEIILASSVFSQTEEVTSPSIDLIDKTHPVLATISRRRLETETVDGLVPTGTDIHFNPKSALEAIDWSSAVSGLDEASNITRTFERMYFGS